MDILKTPQQKLMESVGVTPASPGMVMTPLQLLLRQAGVVPSYAGGGDVRIGDMLAELVNAGQKPQKFAKGGMSTPANIGSQIAFNAPFLTPEISELRKNVAAQKYPSAAENAAALALAISPLNPLTVFLSLMSPSELGDATLDSYNKQKAAEAARQQEIARMRARTYSPVFTHNQPVELIDVEAQPSFPSTSRFYKK